MEVDNNSYEHVVNGRCKNRGILDDQLLPYITNGKSCLSSTKPKNQARIYVNVTMDCFHYGHVNFLRQCKEQCRLKFPGKAPYLIVGVCTDEDCAKFKRLPLFNWQERAVMVQTCKYVDTVIKIGYVTPRDLINQMEIDVIVTGTDYNQAMISHDFPGSEHLHEYVKYTKGISTTNIIERVKARLAEDEATMLEQKQGEAELARKTGAPIPY